MSKSARQRARTHYKLLAEGRCRMCLRDASVRALTRHHLVPQRYYSGVVFADRRDANENVVPLCRPCHDLIDCGPWSERRPHRVMLRRLLTAGELSSIRRRRDERWLERHYPAGGVEPDHRRYEEVSTWREAIYTD